MPPVLFIWRGCFPFSSSEKNWRPHCTSRRFRSGSAPTVFCGILPPGLSRFFGIIYPGFLKDGSGGSAAEKKSLFDTLVGTFVETSEGGYSVWLNYLTHREAEFHNLPPCGSKIRDKPVPPPILIRRN